MVAGQQERCGLGLEAPPEVPDLALQVADLGAKDRNSPGEMGGARLELGGGSRAQCETRREQPDERSCGGEPEAPEPVTTAAADRPRLTALPGLRDDPGGEAPGGADPWEAP